MPLQKAQEFEVNATRFQVHTTAIVESKSIGAGTRIWAYAHILQGAKIGRDCNIGDHAFIEGGAVIGHRVTVKNAVMIWDGVVLQDDVFAGPGVIFTNDLSPRSPRAPDVRKRYESRSWLVSTVVKRGASIGANATIVCGITIGKYAMIGAGAVVTRDVPDYGLVVGVPAVLKGWVSETGSRLSFDKNGFAVCPDTLNRWRLVSDNRIVRVPVRREP